jgi:uncharacterized membrane protein YqjE
MSESSNKPGGILASVRGILDSGLSVAENRVELFAVELRQEKCRLVESLIWAVAVVSFAITSLTLLTLAIIILFWENARVAALLALAALYLLGTLLAWRGLRIRLDNTAAFSGTLGEIQKDRECLRFKN